MSFGKVWRSAEIWYKKLLNNEPTLQWIKNPISNQHMTFWPLRLTKFWISQIWVCNLMSLAIIADHIFHNTVIEYSFRKKYLQLSRFFKFFALYMTHGPYGAWALTTSGLELSRPMCNPFVFNCIYWRASRVDFLLDENAFIHCMALLSGKSLRSAFRTEMRWSPRLNMTSLNILNLMFHGL